MWPSDGRDRAFSANSDTWKGIMLDEELVFDVPADQVWPGVALQGTQLSDLEATPVVSGQMPTPAALETLMPALHLGPSAEEGVPAPPPVPPPPAFEPPAAGMSTAAATAAAVASAIAAATEGNRASAAPKPPPPVLAPARAAVTSGNSVPPHTPILNASYTFSAGLAAAAAPPRAPAAAAAPVAAVRRNSGSKAVETSASTSPALSEEELEPFPLHGEPATGFDIAEYAARLLGPTAHGAGTMPPPSPVAAGNSGGAGGSGGVAPPAAAGGASRRAWVALPVPYNHDDVPGASVAAERPPSPTLRRNRSTPMRATARAARQLTRDLSPASRAGRSDLGGVTDDGDASVPPYSDSGDDGGSSSHRRRSSGAPPRAGSRSTARGGTGTGGSGNGSGRSATPKRKRAPRTRRASTAGGAAARADADDASAPTPPPVHMSAARANASGGALSSADVTCALCHAGYKNGDKWRNIRRIHLHWYLLMESGLVASRATGAPLRLLSEWRTKEPYKAWARASDQRVSSHFKVFGHAALANAFEPRSTDVLVHKHCLHAFNFVVKARYDDLVAATGYRHGPTPAEFGSTFSKRDLALDRMFQPEAAKPLYIHAECVAPAAPSPLGTPVSAAAGAGAGAGVGVAAPSEPPTTACVVPAAAAAAAAVAVATATDALASTASAVVVPADTACAFATPAIGAATPQAPPTPSKRQRARRERSRSGATVVNLGVGGA